MITPARYRLPAAAKVAATALVCAATLGASFAAWSRHGSDVFVAMIQTGLSWCF